MTRLALENVDVVYPSKTRRGETEKVLDSVSLELTEGRKLGISGANGSGKTTLLRVMGGIFPPSRGKVTIEGSVGAMYNIGAGTNQRLTVSENLEIMGLLRGYKQSARKEVLEDVAEFGGLRDQLNKPLGILSSGMKMRIFFTFATYGRHDIILLDEWLSLGDSAFRDRARARLDAFIAESQILVLASNSQRALSAHCTEFIHLENGRLQKNKGGGEADVS